MPGFDDISDRYKLGSWFDSRFGFEFRWSTLYHLSTKEFSMTVEASGEGFCYTKTFLTGKVELVEDRSTWLNTCIIEVREGLLDAIARHGKVEPVENTAGVLQHLARMGQAVLA